MAVNNSGTEFAKTHFDKILAAIILVFIVITLIYAASTNIAPTVVDKIGDVLVAITGLLAGLMGAQNRSSQTTRSSDPGPNDLVRTETSIKQVSAPPPIADPTVQNGVLGKQ